MKYFLEFSAASFHLQPSTFTFAFKNKMSSSRNTSKTFCKVCYDAGKPESEYTSHYVKSKPGNDGVVVCPYLLSLVCTYCKKQSGHTASRCPLLQAKKDQDKKTARSSSRSSSSTITVEDGWTSINRNSSINRTNERSSRSKTTEQIQQARQAFLQPAQAKPAQAQAKQPAQKTLQSEADFPTLGVFGSGSKALMSTVVAAAATKNSWAMVAAKETSTAKPAAAKQPATAAAAKPTMQSVICDISSDEDSEFEENQNDDTYEYSRHVPTSSTSWFD